MKNFFKKIQKQQGLLSICWKELNRIYKIENYNTSFQRDERPTWWRDVAVRIRIVGTGSWSPSSNTSMKQKDGIKGPWRPWNPKALPSDILFPVRPRLLNFSQGAPITRD